MSTLPIPSDHERHVRNLAFGYARKFRLQSHLDDLQQEARIGFWLAEKRFRPERGLSFYTIGYYYAKRQMGHYVRALRARPEDATDDIDIVDERDPDRRVLTQQVLRALGTGRDAEIFLRSVLVDRGQRKGGEQEPGSARALAREFGIDRETVARISDRVLRQVRIAVGEA